MCILKNNVVNGELPLRFWTSHSALSPKTGIDQYVGCHFNHLQTDESNVHATVIQPAK